MGQLEFEEIEAARAENLEPRTIKMVLGRVTNDPSHNYAPPAAQEVVGIYILDEEGNMPSDDVVVYSNDMANSSRVRRHTENIEKLVFPLLYPTGHGDTWHDEKRMIENNLFSKPLTARSYARYKKFDRNLLNGQFNPIPLAGKLKCEWIITNHAISKASRVDFVTRNQRKFRVENYKGVNDFLSRYADRNDVPIGRKIILPSTFTGGPRWKAEKFHDSMELVRKFGGPELFITITCNPKHPDLLKELNGRKPEDYPEIVNRHFRLLILDFTDQMKEKKIFGEIEYGIIVYEWQKRGLTHAHTLWKFKGDHWKNNVELLDNYIRAYFCDKEEDPELFELIAKHMVHRPCGDADPKAMCMVDGQCKRHFPKEFSEETILVDDKYPKYKRPNDGKRVKIKCGNRHFDVDNRLVVPYNAYLLKRYNCHINTEYVASLKTVTYLFKYFFKGPDCIKIAITNGAAIYDEVKDFMDYRLYSTHEADWRLTYDQIFWSTHSAERLPLHLDRQQIITFNPDAAEAEIRRALEKDTKLLAWFKYNQEHCGKNDPNTKMTYVEFPYHYVWQEDHWKPRSKHSKPKIVRLRVVDPKRTEEFHLRKLLHIVEGAKSFDDLKKDPDTNIIHESMLAACIARGLARDDSMFIETMIEGVLHKLPKQLRFLYATLIIHCSVKEPIVLWELFKVPLSADYRRSNNADRAEMLAFRAVLKMILKSDLQISDYPVLELLLGLPEFAITDDPSFIIQHRDRGIEMEVTLNVDQRTIFNTIIDKVNNPTPNEANCYMIQAPGGCGKSYTLTCLLSTLIGMGKIVKVMAWSGVAASIYPNGQTCHKTFQLDVPFNPDSNSNASFTNDAGKQLIKMDVLIIDEISMVPKHAFNKFDEKLRELMRTNVPFNGKIVILSGDFRQLPPVVQNGTSTDIINCSVRKSHLWHYFAANLFELAKNERANDVDNFAEEVLAIGDGSTIKNGSVELPEVCIFNGNLVEEVFGDMQNSNDFSQFSNRCILATLNSQVDDYNNKVLNYLDEKTERKYFSVDEVESTHHSITFLPEQFERERPRGFPQHELCLRKHAIIHILRNLSIEDGLCNGTRLMIVELGRHIIKCRKINNLSENEEENLVLLPRITLKNEDGIFILYRHQFPIRLAFSTTINKSQGSTFEFVGIDVSEKIFSHGHLYVALSRTRSWDRIRIKIPENDGNRTRNIVYQSLLTDGLQETNDKETTPVLPNNDIDLEIVENENEEEAVEEEDQNLNYDST
uniref:ATP-dependent DNA helicase n=1 Tax=Panagrolaimus sp. JU765 TaxID=591449 RepID=A0AC34QAX8_9BILA